MYDYFSSSNLTTAAPGEWKKNESDDVSEVLKSPCVGNFVAGDNRSAAMVTVTMLTWFLPVIQIHFMFLLRFFTFLL